MTLPLKNALPSWVEADFLRSRATDALGLQNTADILADKILPGLSVLTTRARYFGFLCWVRHRLPKYDEESIHSWEVALAFTEADCHPKDEASAGHRQEDDTDCRFIGSRNISYYLENRSRAIRHPSLVFKTPVWRTYRPAMVNVGLVEDRRPWNLTRTGRALALEFGKAVRHRGRAITPLPPTACLSRISHRERLILKTVIGLNGRRAQDGDAKSRATRQRFIAELRNSFRHPISALSPDSLLLRYERIRVRTRTDIEATLHAAVIWEWLTLGLNTIFVGWCLAVRSGKSPKFVRDVLGSLATFRRRQRPTHLATVGDLTDANTIARGLAMIDHALELRGGDQEIVNGDACRAFEIGECLLRDKSIPPRRRVRRFLDELWDLHLLAKQDQLWITKDSDGRYEATPNSSLQVPTIVQPHAYRLSAFGRIVNDLGGIRYG